VNSRLTVRSIQRITKKYGKLVEIPFPVTPELLRRSFIFSTFTEQNKIQITQLPEKHKPHLFKIYQSNTTPQKSKIRTSLETNVSWHVIEKRINEEILWLQNNIHTLPEKYTPKNPFINCSNCILRKIAILIVSKKIQIKDIRAINENLWLDNSSIHKNLISHRHGKKWHQEMMNLIHNHFANNGYKVMTEPALMQGRADLGIQLKSQRRIYIEVGTITLFKLWYNLSTMKNVTFLIVPSKNKIVEFKT